MRKFIVNVGNNSYEVEVEEVGAVSSARSLTRTPLTRTPLTRTPVGRTPAPAAPVVAASAPAAPVAAAPVAPAAPAVATPVAPSANATSITAPMPGNILDVKVKVGDTVSADSVVIILEAMKMENEIFSGVNGTVTAVNVAKGVTVNSGDVLVVIG